MNKIFEFSFDFDHVPSVMTRGRHALIVVKNKNGKYVLGSKNIYPENIYRFVGGGIDEGEDELLGAVRELEEELGIVVSPDKLEKIAQINTSINQSTKFTTHLFFFQLSDERITPNDDLDDLKSMSVAQMKELIQYYSKLSDELVIVGGDKKNPFCWSDYGELYGKIHQIALDLTSSSHSEPDY